MMVTENRERGDDRDPAVAMERTLQQIRDLPEFPGGYISDTPNTGIGETIPVAADTRGYPTVLGRMSLRRTSPVLVAGPTEIPTDIYKG